MSKIKLVCSECGGEDVLIDAYAMWNARIQRMEVTHTFDKGHFCNTCGAECTVEKVELVEDGIGADIQLPDDPRPVLSRLDWSREWPKEAGCWWFYGWKYGKETSDKPRLHLVSLVTIACGNLMMIGDGHSWNSEDGHDGWFAKAVLPFPPTESSASSLES